MQFIQPYWSQLYRMAGVRPAAISPLPHCRQQRIACRAYDVLDIIIVIHIFILCVSLNVHVICVTTCKVMFLNIIIVSIYRQILPIAEYRSPKVSISRCLASAVITSPCYVFVQSHLSSKFRVPISWTFVRRRISTFRTLSTSLRRTPWPSVQLSTSVQSPTCASMSRHYTSWWVGHSD